MEQGKKPNIWTLWTWGSKLRKKSINSEKWGIFFAREFDHYKFPDGINIMSPNTGKHYNQGYDHP